MWVSWKNITENIYRETGTGSEVTNTAEEKLFVYQTEEKKETAENKQEKQKIQFRARERERERERERDRERERAELLCSRALCSRAQRERERKRSC